MMKKNVLIRTLLVCVFILTSCTSHKKIEPDDEFAVDAKSSPESAGSSAGDDLNLDGLDEAPTSENKTEESAPAANDDLSLENELNSLEGETAEKNTSEASAPVAETTPPVEEPPVPAPVAENTPPTEVAQAQDVAQTQEAAQAPPIETPAPVDAPPVDAPVEAPIAETPAPVEVAPEQAAPEQAAPEQAAKPATIENVTYQGNSNGGTISISADQPLRYTTRQNSTTNQFIIEVENSSIPNKLKRSLNTKDMASSIGSVDIYQKAGSSISRFVVQLRSGSSEPMVQLEGNTLLIIGSAVVTSEADNAEARVNNASAQDLQNSSIDGKSLAQPHQEIVDLSTDGIMSSDNLEEFLVSNNKFYGKKISIETNKLDVKQAIKFIAEESGVNMILDESVEGNVSLKLKNVPWDQALILLLKTKKLGFKRQGTVLRIGKIEDFQKDEQEAIELKEARKAKEPLIIKRFFIGYANIEDLEKKIKDYLTTIDVEKSQTTSTQGADGKNTTSGNTRTSSKVKETIGKVLGDKRTNSLIVQDTEENMKRIEQLVIALDTQPQQVLIEGKVVEAKESFSRGLGITWNSIPAAATTTNRSRIGINPALDAGLAVLDSNFTWGELDILGSLTARLQLGEREDKVRVLSSPRVAVLSSETATISQTAGLLLQTTNQNGGVTTTTNEVIQVGVNLQVVPTVSNEGTVTLDLNITRSFLPQVDARAPDQRAAKTKVIVRSGQTAVIGGIFESETRDANSGVPGFKDLPILGRLFKSDRDSKSKNELVIFVTPTILKPVATHEKRSNDM
ncbi:MAG: type IV pilus secretin PilQ [Pseudobdellovibrio sp.]